MGTDFNPVQMRTVFGRGGGGGGKGADPSQSSSSTPTPPREDPNTLQSRSTARFLDLWCEGPIVGLKDADKSIYFNDTPLMNQDGSYNFSGISWSKRLGLPYPAQTHMPGFPAVSNAISLGGSSGTKVTVAAGPVVATINNPQADAAVIKLSTPILTYQDQFGNLGGYGVGFRIYVKVNGGSYVVAVDSAINGKCTSPYVRDYRVTLPPGGAPWTIKVERTYPDVTANVHNDLYFVSLTEVIDSKFTHPNSAYIGITIDTAQFSGGAPARSYQVQGLIIKLPSNYNPVTRNYTGAWDGTFTTGYSNNPAWAYYDMLTNNRYGLGLPATAVDPWKWDLYAIAQYSDGVDGSGNFVGVDDGAGGREPRYQCNMLLNTRQEAYAVVNTMTSIFRGMSFWSSGAIRPTADMPKSPVKLVTNSNVLNGEFKYEGTALKARHSEVKVIWNDPADSYRAAVAFVDDQEAVARYGVRQTDLVAYGSTSNGQSIRAGKWVIDTEKTQTETVHFRGGLDMADLFPGDVVNVVDENYAQSVFGGRALDCTSTSITLDKSFIILPSTAYTLQVMLPDGTLASKALTNAAGSADIVTWSGAMSQVPLSGAVWAITSSALQPRQFVIISNTEVDAVTFEFMALFYDPAKYDRVENGVVIPTPIYNATPTGVILPASNATAVMRLYVNGSAIRASALVSWSKSDDSRVYLYEVQVKGPNDPTWVSLGETSFTTIEYQDTVEGDHDFRIRAKGLNNKYSEWLELDGVNLTTAVAPADVVGITPVFDPSGIAFKWTPNTDLNLDHYEIRRGASWAAAVLVSQQADTTYVEKGVAAGSYTYWVKAVTAPQGIYSANAASISVVVTAPSAPAVAAAIIGTDYSLTWTVPSAGSFVIDHYEIRTGASWAAGVFLAGVKATNLQAPITYGGTKIYWVAAVDTSGNYGTPNSASLTVSSASAPQGLAAQVIDNTVVLKWTAPATGTLPIDFYLIKKGATYGTAVSQGNKSGTFTTIIEPTGGSFTYWVAPVDTAGNEGTAVSIAAMVNAPPDYVLRVNWTSTFSGTLSSMTVALGSLFGPVNTTETFAGHFTSRSWAGPSAQVTAGYPVFIEPVPTPASYQEVFDYGTTVPNSLITANVTHVDVGSPVFTTLLETSPDNVTWTTAGTGVAGAQAFATSFRYVRVTVSIASTGGVDVTNITALNVTLSAKLKTDSGTVSAVSTDALGTPVLFGVAFLSVSAIVLNPQATTPLTAVYDFTGGPNPTGFKVYLFNSSGTRVNGTVSWTTRGY
jgi:predicted phage tail protein